MKIAIHNSMSALPSPPPAALRRERAIGVWSAGLQPGVLGGVPIVAQTSKSAVAQVSKPADDLEIATRCRFGNRRYSRLGNLRYRGALHAHGERCPSTNAPGRRPALQARAAFTLIEMLIGMAVFAVVLVVVHSVFYGALQLRNKSIASFEAALPLQHALSVIKRDLANLTPPGGTLSGTLQTTPTTTSSTSLTHPGQQVGPIFYTASGALNDAAPWSEMRKVSYYLMPATDNTQGRQLVRSLTRNLLPVLTEEYEDQTLLSHVEDLTFEFYNGTAWVNTWDSASSSSTTSSNIMPVGIRASLTLLNPQTGVPEATPIELIVPILTQPGTNSTTSTTGGGA